MKINTIIDNDHCVGKNCYSLSMLQSGTGWMLGLSHAIRLIQREGYVENLVPCFDHFACRSGELKFFPENMSVDRMVRFENTSDPSDQAILYAISCEVLGAKGIYVDSYGAYHDDLDPEILRSLKSCSDEAPLADSIIHSNGELVLPKI